MVVPGGQNGFAIECIFHLCSGQIPVDLKHVWRNTVDSMLGQKCVSMITWKVVEGGSEVVKMIHVKAFVNGVQEASLRVAMTRLNINDRLRCQGLALRASNIYIRSLTRASDAVALSQ